MRFLAREEGIRQFLDIGSGIPTQRGDPWGGRAGRAGVAGGVRGQRRRRGGARNKLILDGNPDATVIKGDVRDPAAILAHPETLRLIDYSEPVGVLLVAVLHFVPDGDHEQIIATLRDAVAPGSHLAICHACRDAKPDVANAAGPSTATASPLSWR